MVIISSYCDSVHSCSLCVDRRVLDMHMSTIKKPEKEHLNVSVVNVNFRPPYSHLLNIYSSKINVELVNFLN